MFKFTDEAFLLLKRLEGLELHVHWDSLAKIWDIGYGHTGPTLSEPGWNLDATTKSITEEEAKQLCLQDLAVFTEAVQGTVGKGLPEDSNSLKLSNNQFSALVIFVYNIGVTAFEDSKLGQYLIGNASGTSPDTTYVAGELRRWNKSRGRVVQGLINRREAEIKLWETPDV